MTDTFQVGRDVLAGLGTAPRGPVGNKRGDLKVAARRQDEGATSAAQVVRVGGETATSQDRWVQTTSTRLEGDVERAKRKALTAAKGERLSRPALSITGMQKWDGRIVELSDDLFTVELRPADGGTVLWADFETELLGPDAARVAEGDLVYVTVRTVETPGRHPSRTASVRLRRIGQWTGDEVADIRRRATEMGQELAPFIG